MFSVIEMSFTGKENMFKYQTKDFELFAVKIWDYFIEN